MSWIYDTFLLFRTIQAHLLPDFICHLIFIQIQAISCTENSPIFVTC